MAWPAAGAELPGPAQSIRHQEPGQVADIKTEAYLHTKNSNLHNPYLIQAPFQCTRSAGSLYAEDYGFKPHLHLFGTLIRTGMYWDVLGCTGMYWCVLVYTNLYWCVLVCTCCTGMALNILV
jgi:hypothetical protein